MPRPGNSSSSCSPTDMSAATRGTPWALGALLGWLAIANIARSTVVPSGGQLAANLTIGVVAVAIGCLASLDAHELGVTRAGVGPGLRLGAVSFGLIATIVTIAATVPASRGFFEDGRTDIGVAGMLLRVFVVIPLGTVLVEELVFRGVLQGLLTRLTTPTRALVTGALIFGAWHVFPAWRNAAKVGDAPFAVALVTFAATSLAGVGFVWLRRRSGSVLAPILAHTATNSVVFALAWTVSR